MSMHPPPDPDELASDLVDGLLPADRAARLRSDPAIAARVEAIEAARAALRVPPPSPPGAVDRAIAATFAALDRGTGTAAGVPDPSPSGERPPPVTHLRSVGPPGGGAAATGGPWAPAHRAKPRSSGMPWLAAAAAIVLLGLVTLGILSGGSGSDDDQASDTVASAEGGTETGAGDSTDQAQDAPLSAAEEGDDAAAVPDDGGGGEAPAAGDSTATTTEARALDRRQLGVVDNADELADRIRSGDDSFPEAAGSPDGQATFDEEANSSTCAGLTDAGDSSRGAAVYVADAVLDGARVRVHLYDQGDGDLRLVATDESCVDVVDAPYSG